jgi:hypothetical protein
VQDTRAIDHGALGPDGGAALALGAPVGAPLGDALDPLGVGGSMYSGGGMFGRACDPPHAMLAHIAIARTRQTQAIRSPSEARDRMQT